MEERWDEEEEEVEEEGDACWGCGAVSCVFKRARNGRLLCRPGEVCFQKQRASYAFAYFLFQDLILFAPHVLFRRPRGEIRGCPHITSAAGGGGGGKPNADHC